MWSLLLVAEGEGMSLKSVPRLPRGRLLTRLERTVTRCVHGGPGQGQIDSLSVLCLETDSGRLTGIDLLSDLRAGDLVPCLAVNSEFHL